MPSAVRRDIAVAASGASVVRAAWTARAPPASPAASWCALPVSTTFGGTPVKKSKPWPRRRAANSRPGITPAASPCRAAAAHHAQEVTERGEPHERVLPLLVADGGLGAAVVVAREQPRVVGQRAEALG